LPPLPKDAPTVGPHDGPAYALPQGLGYAEVTNEPKAGERDRTAATAIVVYFLKPDAKGAIEAAPSDVKFQVAPSGRNKAQTVALKADPRSGDPAGGGRFASQPGPYQLEELRGELTGKAGATPFKIEIAGAR
jgi:hypothetical protein